MGCHGLLNDRAPCGTLMRMVSRDLDRIEEFQPRTGARQR